MNTRVREWIVGTVVLVLLIGMIVWAAILAGNIRAQIG